MGFGLLFIGYFVAFLMSINPYGWAFQIVGFYLIFCALRKLFEYKHSVSYALLPLVGMTLCQAFLGIHSLGFFEAMTGNLFSAIQYLQIETTINTVFLTLVMIFHFLLLRSIKELAVDVEDLSIARLATRNTYIVGAYFLLDIVVTFLPESQFTTVLFIITLLASIVYPIFVLHLFYRCYAGICAPEDKDMEPKPSRFAFINKSREMSRKKDSEMSELIDKMEKQKQQKKK